jgi:hypothetical protein
MYWEGSRTKRLSDCPLLSVEDSQAVPRLIMLCGIMSAPMAASFVEEYEKVEGGDDE